MIGKSRSWWFERLGARPDRHGSWRVTGRRDVPEGAPADWCLEDVELHSYGERLVSVVVRPTEPGQPCPAVVVPFYDVDSVLAVPGDRAPDGVATGPARRGGRGYAAALARRGLAVLAVPWWFEQRAAARPDTAGATELSARYGPAAEEHARRRPGTGLGRAVADLLLAVDALVAQPWVDPGRLGAFGHSLGGKLVLHLAALDERIHAAAAHEPGVGFAHSNWAAPWYWGERLPTERDQDDLLGLVAPRSFLLAGGGASDGQHNRHLVERARGAWPGGAGLDVLSHGGGHPLPDRVLGAIAGWLSTELARP